MSEDYVIALPSTVEAYKASLGKSTVTGLRHKLNKLRRNHPSFDFKIHDRGQVDERVLEDIFGLKNSSSRNVHAIDEGQKTWLREVVREKGFVGVSSVNGRICAGVICTQLGNNFFLHVIAHDMAFDAYSLGTLNAFLTICETIGRGGSEFHCLWGPSTWKDRLGAKPLTLDNIVVYRSWLSSLLCLRNIAACLLSAYWRRCRLGLINAADPTKPFGSIACRCLDQWYRLKRLAHRLRSATAQERRA